MSRNLREALRYVPKLLELAEKPDAEEFKQIFKVIMMGFTVLGLTAFGIALTMYYILQFLGIAQPQG